MKNRVRLIIILFLFLNAVDAQNADTAIKIRRPAATTYFIDGFKVYSQLSKADSTKLLKDFVSALNGCWTSEGLIHSFTLSEKTCSGTWSINSIHATSATVSIELVNRQVKLLVTDRIGGNRTPGNIRVDEKELTLERVEGNGTHTYTRLKKCP